MTPSGWHDDARNRDAGHDEMQIAVFDYLNDLPKGPSPFYETGDLERSGVCFEMPFRSGGHIQAWGDVVEIWGKTVEDHGRTRCIKVKYVVWEIKPKIYSVGAVKRQCVALRDAVESTYARRRDISIEYDVVIIPLVPLDDPKLAMLRHVYFAGAWDGERIS